MKGEEERRQRKGREDGRWLFMVEERLADNSVKLGGDHGWSAWSSQWRQKNPRFEASEG
jgi:hypothetical protein